MIIFLFFYLFIQFAQNMKKVASVGNEKKKKKARRMIFFFTQEFFFFEVVSFSNEQFFTEYK